MKELGASYYTENRLLVAPDHISRIEAWIMGEKWLDHQMPDPFVRYLEFGKVSGFVPVHSQTLVAARVHHSNLERKTRIHISPLREESGRETYGERSVELVLDELYQVLDGRFSGLPEKKGIKEGIMQGATAHLAMVNEAVEKAQRRRQEFDGDKAEIKRRLQKIAATRQREYPATKLVVSDKESPWSNPYPVPHIMGYIERGMELPPSVSYRDTPRTIEFGSSLGKGQMRATYGDNEPERTDQTEVYVASLDVILPNPHSNAIGGFLGVGKDHWLREAGWSLPFTERNPFDFEFQGRNYQISFTLKRQEEGTFILVNASPNYEKVFGRLKHIAQVVFSMEMR